MQLLRDNLTLWTSSESGDAEDPAAAAKEEPKAEAKTEEAAPAAPAAEESK